MQSPIRIPAFRRLPVFVVLPLALLAACSSTDTVFIDEPPAIPSGVTSITGDGAVYVRWLPNKEPDLAGYRIWWDGDFDEEFEELAVIAPFEEGVYQYNGTESAGDDYLLFEDFLGFDFNGTYNSYAVSAFDEAGNESGLSWEFVVDVPRPEGYDLTVDARGNFPQTAGYDLSSLSEQAQPWNALSTDFWFDFDGGGIARFYVPNQFVRILDAGYQGDDGYAGLDGVDFAPTKGWSLEGSVEAIRGHTYVLRIDEGSTIHYAKIWLDRIQSGSARLWWAYQQVPDEPQFGQPRPEGATGQVTMNQEEVER